MADNSYDGLQVANLRVTLQVGERRFTTLRDTLRSESSYFAARLSSRWNDTDEDGSYFIDADPAMFEHVLRYLRSGNFPVFFNASTQTFDHAKYISLLSEARYFGIPRLEEWIEKDRYLDIVQIKKSTTVVPDIDLLESGCLNKTMRANTRIDFSITWDTERVYVCPRNILAHSGDQTKCGQACEKARARVGDGVTFEDRPFLRAVITETKMSLNLAACMGN
ncbi:BTB/POZ protein [Hypoxylon rubiginosum]|uniref:BTB/POZ protein n=1 Tax=Hypoxylon rubiginosum TaxID=110542 RepID=A0ACB9YI59_9PEZI|nr:BTB/POZ protein [Hypoxylon rubiginosum]